jgi:hypothetical protein
MVAGWKNKLESAVDKVAPAAMLAQQYRKTAAPRHGARKK